MERYSIYLTELKCWTIESYKTISIRESRQDKNNFFPIYKHEKFYGSLASKLEKFIKPKPFLNQHINCTFRFIYTTWLWKRDGKRKQTHSMRLHETRELTCSTKCASRVWALKNRWMKALIDFDWPGVVIPAKKWLLKCGSAQRVRKAYKLAICLFVCKPKEFTISLQPNSKSSIVSRL